MRASLPAVLRSTQVEVANPGGSYQLVSSQQVKTE